MSTGIRPAYSMWPQYNQRLRDVVAGLNEEQLDITHEPRGWPIWAVVGHLVCQRVFWICDFLGEPGKETTRFTNAAHDCPGDDDLENVLSAAELADSLEASFRLIERCLETWTIEMLDDEIRRDDFGPDWVHTRGSVLQRVFSHDIFHCGELSSTLGLADLAQIDLWG